MTTQRRKRDRSRAAIGASMAKRAPRTALVEDQLSKRAAALGRLRAAWLAEAHATREVRRVVGEARAAGATWLDVGQVLDVSPQAAHKRFRA